MGNVYEDWMEAPVQSEAEIDFLSIDFAKEKNECSSVFY
jgi:hypothetical protein